MPLSIENDLIRSAQTHGGTALERVLESVWPEAYRIAASILRDRGLAEDAAQDACIAIALGLPALHDTGAFNAWSYTIVVNRAIGVARRRRQASPLETCDAQAVRFDTDDALDVADALARLPVAQRGAVILHYYAGLNSREIAESTGLPRSTIRFHLMLARRTLRTLLSNTPTNCFATSHRGVRPDAP